MYYIQIKVSQGVTQAWSFWRAGPILKESDGYREQGRAEAEAERLTRQLGRPFRVVRVDVVSTWKPEAVKLG
jgi:hypothetical protein